MIDLLTGLSNATRRLFARWRGSTLQLIAAVILPLTILLVAISFGSFFVHQNAMRSMVGERDQRSVQAAANTIGNEIDHRFAALYVLRLLAERGSSDNLDGILSGDLSLSKDFDYGVGFFDRSGRLSRLPGTNSPNHRTTHFR